MDNDSGEFEDGGYVNEAESRRAEFNYSDDDMDEPRFNSSDLGSRLNINNFNTSQQSSSLQRVQDGYRNSYRNSFGSLVGNATQEPPREFMFPKIAKDFCNQMGTPNVTESEHDLVLGTEELIMQLYEEGIGASNDEDTLFQTLAAIPGELLKFWADYGSKTSAHLSEEYAATIGPGPRFSAFAKANFLANLLLRLYQPHSNHSVNDNSPFLRSTLLRGSVSQAIEGKAKNIPLLLLEWMDDYHDPYPSQLDEIQKHRPSPAHHPLFWNTILNSLLRGRVIAVVNALKTAGWRHARNSLDEKDGSGDAGYTGIALKNIEKVVGDAIQMLQQCPATRGDWDIKGSDWTLFRLGIQKAKESLRIFAEGQVRARRDSPETENFGKTSPAGQESYSGIAKKAESRVPWDIYQNLITVYNLILGDFDPIVESSQDWCEATIGLVVWWNPSRDDRRLILGRSRPSTKPNSANYLRRIADSFYRATDESTDLQVNTNNPVEVGLACLFEGDIESVISLLSSWSGPVSTAIVEIATLGRWLPHDEPRGFTHIDGLDQDDMDVLGINPQPDNVDSLKDQTLIVYATALAQCSQLESKPRFGRPKLARNGWELAIEVLGRLDSAKRTEEEVSKVISDFPIHSGVNVEKLWRLLNELGMTVHAENVAEVSSLTYFIPLFSHFLGVCKVIRGLQPQIRRSSLVLCSSAQAKQSKGCP
jgi:Nup85 Nucleoporin